MIRIPSASFNSRSPRRRDQAKARREGDTRVSASYQLVPVIQEDVTDADSGARKASGVQSNERVTKLVAFITGDRPFLGEGVIPVFAIREASEAGNVLHDAKILVVGFFHQEAVVLDTGFDRGRRVLLAREGTPSRTVTARTKKQEKRDSRNPLRRLTMIK
jgi:hypothetical protein